MTTVLSGANAIAFMKAHSSNVPGMCLNTIYQAYGSHDTITPGHSNTPDAISAWNWSAAKHPGDTNPPAGVPVFFGPSPTRHDSAAAEGDVALSLGGGQIIATDVGGAGKIGVTTISARASAIQRPYLGWTGDFLGYPVQAVSAAVAPGGTVLKVGVTGTTVRILQHFMNETFPAYSKLIEDGVYGPRTAAVIQEFQRRVGIASDGIVGPVTWSYLHRYGLTGA